MSLVASITPEGRHWIPIAIPILAVILLELTFGPLELFAVGFENQRVKRFAKWTLISVGSSFLIFLVVVYAFD